MKKTFSFSLTDAADRLLCRPLFGIPFFFAVLSAVFFLSFCGISEELSLFLQTLMLRCGEVFAQGLLAWGVSDTAVRYLIGGIYRAAVSAVAFLPQTVVFFVLIRALGDCGYLVRAIFVTDRFFRIFGISGNAVVPLMLGYGCASSAVCGCATDGDRHGVCACSIEPAEEKAVMQALPFVPCSARLPVLLFLADAFFPNGKVLFSVFIFALSFALIFISLLTSRVFQNETKALILELPPFRLPAWCKLLREADGTARAYLLRAATAVTVCCTVFSVLAMLTPSLRFAKNGRESILFVLADGISPLFRPLGFEGKETASALIFGFFAKENMICVWQALTEDGLGALLSPASAVSFAVFATYYAPCASLLFAIARKRGKFFACKLFLRTFSAAYLLSLILYTWMRVICW